jgi:hypothetical protein
MKPSSTPPKHRAFTAVVQHVESLRTSDPRIGARYCRNYIDRLGEVSGNFKKKCREADVNAFDLLQLSLWLETQACEMEAAAAPPRPRNELHAEPL